MSALRQAVAEYLALRRGLGYKLERAGRLLPEFVTYLEAQGCTFITAELALDWTKAAPKHASPMWCATRLRIVRGFARYLSARDERTEIPGPELAPYRPRRPTPYLYSAADLARLLSATATLQRPLMRSTYASLLGLLACTGMRVGEALALDRDDIEWAEGVLTIRHAKFGKTREVPLHPTALAQLRRHDELRDECLRRPRSPRFFLSSVGTPLIYNNVGFVFLRLVRHAGLADARPRRPRIHDLRHTFAVATLLRWYRAGLPVAAWLPRLSTYLGHVNPSSTYWYLTATPELLTAAAELRAPRPAPVERP